MWSNRDTSNAYRAFVGWERPAATRQLACKLGPPEAQLKQALFTTSRRFQETSKPGWQHAMQDALSQADTRQKLLALLQIDNQPQVQLGIPTKQPLVRVMLGIPVGLAGWTLFGYLIQ